MFSTSCHYALQGILHIAYHHNEDRNIDLKQIAEEQNIPKHFLSKILQILVRKNLLVSTKGPSGGFRLKREPEDISLIEIIDAIDGMGVFTKCGIGFKQCSDDNPCPIHEDYKKVRHQVQFLFENKTLAGLVEDSKQGNSIINLSTV